MVIIRILRCGPPNRILGLLVHNDEFVFGRTSGINTCHNVYRTKLGLHALVIACQCRIHLVLIQFLIGRIVDQFFGPRNAILG